MRNSTAPRVAREMSTNVIYNFKCQQGHCNGTQSYIGRTSTTLRRRLQSHKNNGAILDHFISVHDRKPALQTLIDNTKIEYRESRFRKLQIAEAVFIHTMKPTINVQKAVDFILPSARRPRITQNIITENVNIEFYQPHENFPAHTYNTRHRTDNSQPSPLRAWPIPIGKGFLSMSPTHPFKYTPFLTQSSVSTTQC